MIPRFVLVLLVVGPTLGGLSKVRATPVAWEVAWEPVVRLQLPAETTEAKVVEIVDGDTIKVELTETGNTTTIQLLGMDAPATDAPNDPTGCYGGEAAEQTRTLLQDRIVYLEQDVTNTDLSDRLPRYVWLDHDGTVELANETILRTGAAVVAVAPPDIKRVERLTAAQGKAAADEVGLWAKCGNGNRPIHDWETVSPRVAGPIADCSTFPSYVEAQIYYADHPEEQPVIDADADGQACEGYFGLG